ncbi:hypothetical protein RQM47_16390 [Rubrivirga sp. S365]|uniref:hypothetical protein n=1 Tax=Rubrivirga sp. S365 TaxID=3076080 RepID=UPI0028C77365|nr:hypothetical protein [Rubrivirga sp. S365]MDT7858229.1 hypothetical protein [Rubrivirga sp. S365]
MAAAFDRRRTLLDLADTLDRAGLHANAGRLRALADVPPPPRTAADEAEGRAIWAEVEAFGDALLDGDGPDEGHRPRGASADGGR